MFAALKMMRGNSSITGRKIKKASAEIAVNKAT